MSQVDDAYFFAEPLSPDDRLRLIARLWASLPPEHWAAPSADELAEVERRLVEHDAGQTADVPWEIVNRMLLRHEAAKRGRIYSAPRRFDLATIFAVTTAYSLLFALVSTIRPAAGLPVAGFVTFVGLGQALLFRGMRPRLASVLVGIVCFAAPMTVFSLMQTRMVPDGFVPMMLAYGVLLGSVFGYLAGVLVGGVFLVADVIRRRYDRAEDQIPHSASERAKAPDAPPQPLDGTASLES